MGVTAAPQIQPLFRNLLPGDPAPWFKQRSTSSPNYAFDTAAGRYVVMCFFGTARDNAGQTAIATVQANRNLFDDQKACFFGVSVDEQDQETGRVSAMLPGLRYFWDFDFSVAQLWRGTDKHEARRSPTAPPLLDGSRSHAASPSGLPIQG
jgi:peroxiredoxin